jgi:hypothetical protein
MPENLIVILVVLLIVGGIVAVIAYNIARFMRGSIKLNLLRTAFKPGDIITGNIDLLIKKPVESNKLIVSLIGSQVTKTYEDGKPRTRSHEIYRDEILVEGATTYPGNHTSQHEFSIAVPNTGETEFANSTLGQALTTAAQLLSNKQTHLKWKIDTRLDAKGIDLMRSIPVSINMPR